jgi:hypothetical protein
MRALPTHISRLALSSTCHGRTEHHGACFEPTTGVSPEHAAFLADDSYGRAIAEAVALAVRTSRPRSAYHADDPLGFSWSIVCLLGKSRVPSRRTVIFSGSI